MSVLKKMSYCNPVKKFNYNFIGLVLILLFCFLINSCSFTDVNSNSNKLKLKSSKLVNYLTLQKKNLNQLNKKTEIQKSQIKIKHKLKRFKNKNTTKNFNFTEKNKNEKKNISYCNNFNSYKITSENLTFLSSILISIANNLSKFTVINIPIKNSVENFF